MKNKLFTIRKDIRRKRERREPKTCAEIWGNRNKKDKNHAVNS